MLIGYFDESGTHDEAPVAAIAGYIARVEDWAPIEIQWRQELASLASRGVKTFHMAHCLGQWSEFSRVPKAECDSLIERLSGILERADIKAIWSAVDVPDWNAVTTSRFREVFPKPYDFCFQGVLREIMLWQRQHLDENEEIQLFFSLQDEYEQRSLNAFKAWKANNPEFFKSLTYASPRDFPALQATDMLAHQTHVEWRMIQHEGLTARNNYGYNPLLTKITTRNGMGRGGLYDALALQGVLKSFERQPSSHGAPAA
jgi:Protein of unknown function (DUF3800)